jgi:hypothetical protein
VLFSINPESLSLKRSNDLKEDGYGDASPAMLFDGGKFDELEFSVLLDESEYRSVGASALSALGAVTGLAGLTTQLMSAAVIAGTNAKSILTTYNSITDLMAPKLDTADAMVRPCIVKFTWGDMVFVGAIESADLDVKLWDQNGIPRRGIVKVSMKGRYNWSGTSEDAFFPSVDAST